MPEPEASLEVERKYSAPPGFVAPSVPTLGSWTPERRFDLRAEYYDTPDRDLARNGVTLRRRTGGEDEGWHLKSPAVGGRMEERLGLDAGQGGVPDEFRERLGALVVGVPLIPVAVIATIRHQADLTGDDGRVLAHLCADAVTADGGGSRQAWNEVECELAPGEPLATLDAVEAALFEAGCSPAEHSSKAMRAMGPIVPRPPLTLASPGADVVLAYVAQQVGALQTHAAGVRSDGPDAVHKSRVASRRLRSALRCFGPLLDAERAGALIDELRWYGEVAGAPRDAEVLKAHLLATLADVGQPAADGPVGTRLAADLDATHAAAHARLVEVLDGAPYAALERHLVDFLVDGPVSALGAQPTERVVRDIALAAVRRVGRRYRRALADPADLARWHDVRKAAKAVRYACEALASICGVGAEETAGRWEAVTEALGDVQDTVVTDEVLADLGRAAADRGEPTETYGVLRERQLAKRKSALASGREALVVALADPLAWLP